VEGVLEKKSIIAVDDCSGNGHWNPSLMEMIKSQCFSIPDTLSQQYLNEVQG
jgi:hypothetical protein